MSLPYISNLLYGAISLLSIHVKVKMDVLEERLHDLTDRLDSCIGYERGSRSNDQLIVGPLYQL